MRRATPLVIAVALGAATLAACSGAPRPQALKVGEADRVGEGAGASAEGVASADAPLNPDGTPAAGPAAPGAPGATTAGGGKSAGGSSSQPGAPTIPGTGGLPSTPQPGDANLFAGSANARGITDNQITLCGHAALVFGQAFDTRVEDLNVYWDELNTKGGVHGRKVVTTFEDDRYDGAAARDAAIACKAKNPFLILGGIGFDQIPTVRVWAEQNKELYYHHIAVAKGSESLQYSFTPQPSVEEVGVAFGQHISAKYGNQTVGIIYRDSEYWEPGRSSGKQVLQDRGVRIVSERGVQKNQGAFSAEIVALQQADGGKGAKVVWIWENALGAGEFIQQAWAQGYYPTFVVFPFQTTLDIVGKNGLKSPIEGIGTWTSYKQGGYGGLFPEHDYEGEIKRFEAAMAKHRPGVKPNDILWQVWLANKAMHDMFDACGRACTRNRFAGLMLNGYHKRVEPNCDVDFSRGNHRRGGYEYTVMSAYALSNSEAAYKTTAWCRATLG